MNHDGRTIGGGSFHSRMARVVVLVRRPERAVRSNRDGRRVITEYALIEKAGSDEIFVAAGTADANDAGDLLIVSDIRYGVEMTVWAPANVVQTRIAARLEV